MPVRKYKDDVEAGVKVMARSGESERSISKKLDIPKSSVHKILLRPDTPGVAGKVAKTTRHVIKDLDEIRDILAAEMKTKDLSKSNIQQLATSMAIAIDKSRLLSGEATELIGIMGLVGKTDQELDKIMKGEVQVTDGKKEPQPAEATKH